MKYIWSEIQKEYDLGKTAQQVREQFGFARASWTKAIKSGRIVPRPKTTPLEKLNPKSRKSIKNRLLESGVPYQCNVCHISTWMGKPISLQLDHIDGDHSNMSQDNLQLICPNCHSQTETFCGKNTRRFLSKQRG